MKFDFFALPSHSVRKKLRPVVIGGTLLLSLCIVLLPPPEGLTREGMNAIAIFVLCFIFWATNAIPLMVTSMFAIVLLPLLGVLDANTAYALFGNQAVFFILGAFILASALMRSGLSTRIALLVLRRFGHSRRSLLLSLLFLPAILSFFMSEHAVAAMLFPIVLEIVRALRLQEGNRYATGLFLAMTWGCIIGGVATFLGGARALLAVSILQETTGQTIEFLQWSIAALPVVIILLGCTTLLVLFITKKETPNLQHAAEYLDEKVEELGALSHREKAIGLLMIATVFLWVFYGHALGLANIALLAVVVAFMGKLMSWKEVQEDVNWGIILMYGGAIALGFGLSDSGAAAWLSQIVIDEWVTSSFVLLALLAVISLQLTEGISNSAVIALLMPIALAVASQFHVDPRAVTLAIAIPSGLAFMFPISTPATAIAVSSRFVSVKDTMMTGFLLNILSIIVCILVIAFYWPHLDFLNTL